MDAGTWVARLRVVVVRLVPVALVAVVVAAPVWSPYLLRRCMPPLRATPRRGTCRRMARPSVPRCSRRLCWGCCVSWGAHGRWPGSAARRRREDSPWWWSPATPYYCLSQLALAFGTTLLSFKLEFVLPLTLACAGALAVPGSRTSPLDVLPAPALGRPVGGAVLGVIACVHLVQTPSPSIAPLVDAPFTAYDDTGSPPRTPAPSPAPDEPGTWNAQLDRDDRGAERGRPRRTSSSSRATGRSWTFRPYPALPGGGAGVRQPARSVLGEERGDRAVGPVAGLGRVGARARRDRSGRPTSSCSHGPTQGLASHDPVGVRLPFHRRHPPAGGRLPLPVFDGPAFQRADVGPFTVITQSDRGAGCAGRAGPR